jgi:predicted Rossmann fold nucleotide-binding protein DprA/Smf involved in DNA uptake
LNAASQGYLLLCCDLGEPDAKPLTMTQLHTLRLRVKAADRPAHKQEALTLETLAALGCTPALSAQILQLLSRGEALSRYLSLARQAGCFPVTCLDADYPPRLRQLGKAAPVVFFGKGDRSLLSRRCIGAVGSRRLLAPNRAFAEHVGTLAAREGFLLTSGNACGADQTAQNACLSAGGGVIAFVPNALPAEPLPERLLMLSEGGFHCGSSAARALRRNAFIHALAEKVFVAQSGFEEGGTWAGTTDNLRHGWSQVCAFDDGSPAARAFAAAGASMLEAAFPSISGVAQSQKTFF